MSRCAILIADTDPEGDIPLPGAVEDVNRLESYLRSNLGGAWNKPEIHIHVDHPWDIILGDILSVSKTDYVFVAYSGHGTHGDGADPLATQIKLSGDIVSMDLITPPNNKNTVVLDCCREVVTIEDELFEEVAGMVKIAKKQATREDFRNAFDAAVRRTAKGTNYVFACGIDQFARIDNARGSVFTQTLVAQAAVWDANYSGINTSQRMNSAVHRVNATIGESFPQVAETWHTQPIAAYFPFAVHLG